MIKTRFNKKPETLTDWIAKLICSHLPNRKDVDPKRLSADLKITSDGGCSSVDIIYFI